MLELKYHRRCTGQALLRGRQTLTGVAGVSIVMWHADQSVVNDGCNYTSPVAVAAAAAAAAAWHCP